MCRERCVFSYGDVYFESAVIFQFGSAVSKQYAPSAPDFYVVFAACLFSVSMYKTSQRTKTKNDTYKRNYAILISTISVIFRQ